MSDDTENSLSSGKRAGIIVFAIVFVMSLYIGSYFLMMRPVESTTIFMTVEMPNVTFTNPKYRFGNKTFDDRIPNIVFWPVHQIDRTLRPSLWAPKPGMAP